MHHVSKNDILTENLVTDTEGRYAAPRHEKVVKDTPRWSTDWTHSLWK